MTWLTYARNTRLAARGARRGAQPRLELLESRTVLSTLFVVPTAAPLDATHFHFLPDAIVAASTNDTIEVMAGASGSAGLGVSTTLAATAAAGSTALVTNGPVTAGVFVVLGSEKVLVDSVSPITAGLFNVVLHSPLQQTHGIHSAVTETSLVGLTKNLRIFGDPSTAPAPIPDLEVLSGTIGARLDHLTTNNIVLDAGSSNISIVNSLVTSLAGTSYGGAVFDADTILGAANITGNPGTTTGDTFQDMQFASGATLTLLHEDGAVVKNCSFSGSPAIALTLDSSQVVLVVDNAFNLSGPTTAIEVRNATSATGLTLDSNTVNAGASGTGVKVIKSPGNALNVSLQGNDYHGSGVGIAVIGDGTTAGTIDAGGGSLGSQGANNFRSFTSGGTASGGFAIEVANTGLAFVLSARNNLFSASNPATVVKDATHNTAVGGGLNGTGSVDVGATQRTAAESFVETLYHNFLGRVADAAGLANWQGLVQTQGTLFVASNIIHSTEAETRLVDAAYLKYLDRTADAGGAAGWVNFLQQGGTEEQVVAGLLGSTEFANRANGLIASGNPDTNFVQAVYSLLLGRSASSAEVQNWVNAIPSIGRNGVALKILGSTEYRQDATGQYYLSYLHRAASAADESAWAGSTYDLLSIKANITSSGEYFVNG